MLGLVQPKDSARPLTHKHVWSEPDYTYLVASRECCICGAVVTLGLGLIVYHVRRNDVTIYSKVLSINPPRTYDIFFGALSMFE